MLLHLDRSDLRQFQIAVGQEDVLIDADSRIAVLSVSFGFESWKSFFRLIEEVLEGLIQMAERLLKRNAVHFLQESVLFCFLQYGQFFGTGSIAQGRLVFFVSADLLIEPMVVDKADTAECLCKEDLLYRSWIESEFIGFIWHIVSSLLSLISLYCIFTSLSTEKLSFAIHLSPIEVRVFLPIVDKVNTDLSNIYAIIQEAIPENKQNEVIRGFWDMFIIDCLIGNIDRHLDNWGVTSDFSFAPIYDCGSSFYPLISIEQAKSLLNNPSLLKGVAINIHSVYSFNGQKIQYSKIGELDIPELKQALKRVGPKIDLEKIKNIIYDTPYLAQELKDLYYQSIEIRYNTYLKKEIDKSLGKDTRSKTQIRKAERALRHQKTFSKNEGQNR